MKKILLILISISFIACNQSKKKQPDEKKIVKSNNSEETKFNKTIECNYINFFKDLGNTKIDTLRIERRLIDPIDDSISFKASIFDFVTKGNKVFKKSKTHRRCDGKFIDVEYYQEFTNRIELASYKKYNDRFFTTKNRVNFWWANSDGHLIIPINNADPKTFKPFENICGGTDMKGVYYGCPNFGVYKLDIPVSSKFEFIPKKDNYWNSPKHYVIVDNKVYDIKRNLKKGYFCELDMAISAEEIKKNKS
ncbi:hypothetical protein PG911_13875 [Tenacibaculum ovolyticum]|uniref:hypothetical protein n=1 Tax=Tenacibaculum ovolyticum TaxID=104270 RepID=UPI00041579F6|nr:hypothetical protein [Tenacibaculum ovolyticum]WBX75735.1 hypothetical protein PG911_13875 [Tenacibaculum ovolyticum]